jgi:hypothetical protein
VESLGSRELLRSMLAYLYDGGWVLTTSIGLSEKPRSKDTLLFKKTGGGGGGQLSASATAPLPPPVDWLVVQFSHGDRIFLHGSKAAGLVAGIRGVLVRLGLHEKGEWNNDAYEICLKGTPWRQNGEKSMQTRVLLLEMAEELDRQGWQSYGTIHQRSNTDDWKACDSWYLIRPRAAEARGRPNSSTSGCSRGIDPA